MEKSYLVYCPLFKHKYKETGSLNEAIEKAQDYAKSHPGTKFFVAEIIGGFEDVIVKTKMTPL